MQSKSGNGNQVEPNPHAVPPTNVYTEPWWRGIAYNPISAVPQGNASNSSSLEVTNGASESNCAQSQSDEDDDGTKDSQPHPSVGNHGQEQHMQHVSSAVPAMHNAQPPQLELVGHSIACTSNPYQDPYFGGMVAAYGHQPLGYPPFVGIPQGRMPLTLEMTQEPVYVNAKQYQGILRRRQARAKAELERKLIKARKPYLHESRHQHAMRRARGTGGRFAKKSGNDSSEEKGTGPRPSHSATSSGSEPLQSDSAETWNYQNGSGNHHNHSGLQSSTYSSAQRPLAIQ